MTAPRRLVSGWYAAFVVGLTGLLTGVGVAATLVEDGVSAWAWGLLTGAGALFVVAVVVALAWPRRPRDLAPGADGTVVVASPAVLVGALMGAWMLALASAAVWVYLAVTDLDRVTEQGPLAVFAVGALASTPLLVRLLSGRLHRWRLTMTAEGLTYQGFRSTRSEPWSAVRGASTARGRPAGVRVDLKASRPELTIPVTAFLVEPAQLADEISRRAGGSNRR